MKWPAPSTLFKTAVIVVYLACFFGISWYLHSHGLGPRDLAFIIHEAILEAGWLGPFAVILFYLIQILIPFPTVGLSIISGALYGPGWGIALVMCGLIVSGSLTFWVGRYFGRHFISEHEKGWIKKYDEMLKGRGFFTVLFMRLFMFPFDFVSLGCGMTQMSFRQYLIGTFFGVIPSAVTFTVLGDVFHRPHAWVAFAVLFAVSATLAVLFRYSKWGKMLFSPKNDKSDLLLN